MFPTGLFSVFTDARGTGVCMHLTGASTREFAGLLRESVIRELVVLLREFPTGLFSVFTDARDTGV